jgi:hypothetical protein
MLSCWEALNIVERELPVLVTTLAECYEKAACAKIRSQGIDGNISTKYLLDVFDDGLNTLRDQVNEWTI